MTDGRVVSKTLSALAMLVVGGAGAGAALASPAPPGSGDSNVLATATRISSLHDLYAEEFELRSTNKHLVAAAAGGHHDDSFGSHHHHDAAAMPINTASATERFNV